MSEKAQLSDKDATFDIKDTTSDLISRQFGRLTDTELKRREAICKVANVDDIGNLSDGFHTFNALYEQRMILFAALVKAYKEKAWKSYRHEDGEYCFGGGWFIVGIDTPEGSYTYHYENKYWDMFDCIDLPRAKHWDGHTEADAEIRLMSLVPEREKGEWLFVKDPLWAGGVGVECSKCGSGFPFASFFEPDEFDYCPRCGRHMLTPEDIKRRKRHEHKVPDKWIVRGEEK